jgi:hypothetical protein
MLPWFGKKEIQKQKRPEWAFVDCARQELINGRTVAARNAALSVPGRQR